MRYSDFKIVESKRKITESIGTTRITVGDTTYEVGNDLIMEGGVYQIFSGASARQWAEANNTIVPPREVIMTVYQQARPLQMPIRNNNPTDTNAAEHHRQIIELNGQPSGLVAGHKKEITASGSNATHIYGGRWPEGYGRTAGSIIQSSPSPHDQSHMDYSQGMRICRIVEGEGASSETQGAQPATPPTGQAPEQQTSAETVDGVEAGPPYPADAMEKVRQMQTKLQSIGYNVGQTGIDGKYGPRTTRAVRAYKTDHNVDGEPNQMTDEQLTALQSAQQVANVTPTGNESSSPMGGPATGGQPGSLEGTNVLAANPSESQLPNQNIIDALDEACRELNIQVQITPNGGRASRDGTKNHPPGEAADIQIVRDGNIIRPGSNSALYDRLIQTLVANATQRGVRPGIGGYPWGIHYDESGWRQGKSSIAGVWNNGFNIMTGVNAAERGLA